MLGGSAGRERRWRVKRTISRRNLGLALATLAVAAAGCSKREAGGGTISSAAKPAESLAAPGGVPGVTADTIKIGSWGPLSGPAAPWGTVLYAMNAYFQFINESGGVNGRKIQFIYRDDQYSPAKTPAVVRELVEKEQVFAIVGGIGTANGRAVADYLEQQGVPFFTPASGDRFWSEGGKRNVYTVFPKYVSEAGIMADYIGKELKAKKVAVLYQDDDFGKQGLEGIKKGLAKHPGVELAVEVTCQPTDTDLSGQASKIIEKRPDVLVLYATPKQAVALVKTLDAQKKKPQVMTSFVLSDPILFKLAGDSWEGTITSAAAKMPDEDDEAVKMYRDVLAKYGGGKIPVGTFSMSGFLFAIPFVEALNKAGKDLTREKVYEALNTFDAWSGPALYWKGASMGPPITFKADRRLGNEKIYLAKAKAGKWEKITDWLSPGT
jgi:ABC-type branched-subunit amino acid transport system substrate-binding protein